MLSHPATSCYASLHPLTSVTSRYLPLRPVASGYIPLHPVIPSITSLQASHKMELQLQLTQERARADKMLRQAVEVAEVKAQEKAVAEAQHALKVAVEEAKRQEALSQKAVARQELRDMQVHNGMRRHVIYGM